MKYIDAVRKAQENDMKLSKSEIAERENYFAKPANESFIQEGYYKIINKHEQGIQPWFDALFGETESTCLSGTCVIIRKNPFYNKRSIGPKEKEISIGDIVYVKNSTFERYIWDGEEKSRYKITWEIL